MARVSFVLRRDTSASGSYVRYPDGGAGSLPARTDNDSFLRADGLQVAATAIGTSTFAATVVTYKSVTLDWSVPLSATAGATPTPTSLVIVYSKSGVPHTVASGKALVNTTSGISTFIHDDSSTGESLTAGEWVYYSMFVNYTSTGGDNFYTKVADLEVLIPVDYGSALTLWNQLPKFVRMQDIALGDYNYSADIGTTHGDKVGPLFKYLSIIGFDMDCMRTLIDYVMVSKDPTTANGETLDALADMMGIALRGSELGEARLRGILDNIGVYQRSKGTPAAIKQMIGGITGSNVTYSDSTRQYSIQSQRANYITVPKTGTGLTTWRESYPGESTAGTALNLLRGAEFFIDAGRAVNAEQAALNQGTGGSALNARYGTGTGVDASDPLLLTHTGTNHLYLPGVNGNYVSIPNNPSLNTTGDIELVARVSLGVWIPPSITASLICKGGSGTTLSFRLDIGVTSGRPQFIYSTDGTTALTRTATATPAFTNGVAYWLKATMDVDNGSGSNVVTFYTAPDSSTEPSGGAWTPLGTAVTTAGVTSIFSSTSSLEIGSRNNGANGVLDGKFYRAIVRDGIAGTVVVDVDFTTGITSGNQVSVPFTPSTLSAGSAGYSPQYISNLGTGGRALVARLGSTPSAGTDDPVLLPWTGENHLYVPGTNGNWPFINDNAVLDILGDIELVCRVSADSWNSAAATGTFMSRQTLVDPNRAWQWRLVSGGIMQLSWYPTGSAASSVTAICSAPVPFVHGVTYWLKVTLDVDNGATGNTVKFYYAADQVTEPGSWTQLGTDRITAGVTSLPNVTSPFSCGYTDGSTYYSGRFHRAIVRSGIAGTTVVDANFSTGITSGATSSFTESSTNALTVSISRSAGGRKSVAVTRPTFLFGTDDYIEVADNDLLDFGATDSFTIVAAVRQWATPTTFGRYVDKKIDGGGVSQGWSLDSANTALQASLYLGDGTNQVSRTGSVYTAGTNLVTASVLDRSSATVTGYTNGTNNGSTSTVGLGSLVTNLPMRIGAQGGTLGGYQEFEMYGAAVFRRALTATEVGLINTHYQGTETADSVALLSTAVFWIDPARSSQEMAINRSTTGKKAVAVTRPTWLFSSTYMEVPDNDLLDFGATDSFTVLAVVRQWATSAGQYRPWVSKQNSTGSTQGWSLAGNSGEQAFTLYTRDASTGSNSTAVTIPVGEAAVVAGVRSGTSHKTFSGTTVTDATLVARDTANAEVLRIGKAITGGQVAEGELLAVAVFRRALTATEIATINTYYGTV